MHLEFLVEDLSTKEVLTNLLPKIILSKADYKIHHFRGKNDLLSKLPLRLKGYKNWISEAHKIIILLDQDDDDCRVLKQKLENITLATGLISKSTVLANQPFQVVNRIVIEEIESWFFGDINAINSAYPKVSKNLANQAAHRKPDQIKGGTWEALERILKKAGYHKGGLEKIKAAREISHYMEPGNNRSKSFQVFYQTLRELVL